MSIDTFKRTLRGLMPGDENVYHRGSLAIARDSNLVLCQIATLLLRLSDLGYVILYQKRDNEGVMCYYYRIKERINRERTDEADALSRA